MKMYGNIALGIMLSVLLQGKPAQANYEKTIPWSGKYAGSVGITSSNVSGSEALLSNPAGLAGRAGAEATANFSPTWVQFQGPVEVGGASLDTGKTFIPYGAVTTSYGITDKWSVGIGFGAVGGSRVFFPAVDFSGLAGKGYDMKPDEEAKLTILEASLGTAYEVIPGLKFGAAWRMTMVSGRVSTTSETKTGATAGLILANLVVDDLKTTDYKGFRFGAQYTADSKSWGLGLDWRTPLDFVAKGQSSGKYEFATGLAASLGASNAPQDMTGGGETTLATSLPSRVAFGAYTSGLVSNVTFLTDLIWSEYTRNKSLKVDGVTPAIAGTSIGAQEVALNEQNILSVRFGGEYTGIEKWALRAGYAYSTQSTPADTASATSVAPGPGHCFTVGAGTQISPALSVDGAVEYATASGTGTGVVPGDYSSKAMALHTGATYHF